MSWLFSQALAEEYSEAICSDGEQFAQLNVMPTQHKFWRNDKTMESSRLSQFGLTSRLLTENHGQELLTSYLAGFRAKTYQQQEKAQVLKENDQECGNTWPGLLAKYDLATHTWKTAQCSLLEGSDEFSETWPSWGMMRNGASYLRQIPALRIYGNESGLWPTPEASLGGRGWNRAQSQRLTDGQKTRPSGALVGSSLQWEPRLLSEYTPGAHLNPAWVEWLMGWPVGWTDLKPLEMDKFHEWQQQHGGY